MRSTTAIGIIVGIAILIGVFLWEGGSLEALFIWPAVILVLFGTLAATYAGSSGKHIAKLPSLIGKSFSGSEYDLLAIKRHIYRLSEIYQKNGPLAMEEYLKQNKKSSRITDANPIHPYLDKMTLAIVDGSDTDDLKRISDYDGQDFEDVTNQEIDLFKRMGGFAPTMGIIGTVMGLIATMANAGGSPDELIRHIATAFIATLWGIFLANIVFLPIADKLETLYLDELRIRSAVDQGMISIARGDTPIKVRTLMGGRDIMTATQRT